MTASKLTITKIRPEQVFMGSALLVNGGNYLYNLVLGRWLGPAAFSDAALLITLLLVMSFIGMAFQLSAAKFSVTLNGAQKQAVVGKIYRSGLVAGICIGILVMLFAESLQTIFKTESSAMFTVFGMGIPFYFIMSTNRGKFQGSDSLARLALTYQSEMWSRLLVTLILLLALPEYPSLAVGMGILISFLFGLIPGDFQWREALIVERVSKQLKKQLVLFFAITIFYEFSQIIINNSDIILVKYYFEPLEAGLYASMAMIGRVIYFLTWMFVMLLLPAVVQKQKYGEPTKPLLIKYIGWIAPVGLVSVLGCYLFPQTIINIMFGEKYLSMTHLLWQYALATSLFAMANIFAYYYLSLEKYIPVILTVLMGIVQVVLIVLYHSDLLMVVQMQILVMALLLLIQLAYFISRKSPV